MLAGVGWLVLEALRGAEALTAERHLELATRVFDEVDRELSALVAREEARPFLEYRFFYVPLDNANPEAVVVSPLARAPDDPAIAGWFQLDPDGALRTPREPAASEVDLALQQGWAPGAAFDDEVGRVVRAIPAWPGPADRSGGYAEPVRADDEAEAPGAQASVSNLNRGAVLRKNRLVQKVVAKDTNLVKFEQDAAACAPDADAPVDVDVAPMTGLRVGDHLVLSRLVTSGPSRWRQGLVLRVPPLEQRLADTVLAGSGLEGALRLAWDDAPAPEGRWRTSHRFDPPFGSLRLAVGVAPVPELVASRGVVALSAALAAAVLLGAAALAWAVRAELAYAQRRSDFVAAVSHELKTPLTTIRMYAEMLRDGMVPPERHRDYHGTITAEADRLSRLIANVLALARLERGGPPPAAEVGALGPAVREALEVVRPHAEAEGFRLVLDEAPDLPPVRFERDGVLQIVVNLVDNALKFARGGDRVIAVALRPEGAGVALEVRDRGPGVPPAHLARVFEPFWRGERELTRTTSGTGLGLALVRGLAAGMGGRVVARNHPDGGFEVRVLLG